MKTTNEREARLRPRGHRRGPTCVATLGALALFGSAWLLVGCGGPKGDARFPPRPEGCDVKLFHGKVAGMAYDNIGGVDAICGTDIGTEACMTELKNQTCKLGGDIVYDVPDDPEKPAPDKVRYTGRVAHSRAPR